MDSRQIIQAVAEKERLRAKRRENRREAMNVRGMNYNPGGRHDLNFKDRPIFGCEKCIFDSGEHSCGK